MALLTRNCVQCGALMDSAPINAKLCSPTCQKEWSRHLRFIRKRDRKVGVLNDCSICGKPASSRRKTCSSECRQKLKRNRGVRQRKRLRDVGITSREYYAPSFRCSTHWKPPLAKAINNKNSVISDAAIAEIIASKPLPENWY